MNRLKDIAQPNNRLAGLQTMSRAQRQQLTDPDFAFQARETAEALYDLHTQTGISIADAFQAMRPHELTDPTDVRGIAQDAIALSRDIGPADAIEAAKQQYEPGKEPGLIQQAKQWVREKTGLFEPPIYGQDFRETKPMRTLGKLGAHHTAEAISGLGLSIPDIIAHKVSGAESLADLVDKTTGLRPTPKEITQGEMFQFIGGLKTAGAVTKALVGRVAAREGLKRVLTTGLQFAGRQLSDETAQKVINGDPIDLEKVWAEGGVGVLFGMTEVAIAKGLEKWSAKKLAKLYRQRIPGLKGISEKDLVRTAEAAMDSHKVSAGRMTMDQWHAKHADHLYKFSEQLKTIGQQAAEAKAVAGTAAKGATAATEVSTAMVKVPGAAIEPIRELRQAYEAGKALTASEMRLLTEVGVDVTKPIAPPESILPDSSVRAEGAAAGVAKEAPAPIAEAPALESLEKEVAAVDSGMRAGFAEVPDPKAIGKVYGKIHDKLFRYGEAKRTAPELYKQAMKAYHARNARVDRAIEKVSKVIGKQQFTADQDAELAFAYEDKRAGAPDGMGEVYEGYAQAMQELEQQSIEEGIFQRPFTERMIEEIDSEVARLQQTPNKKSAKKIADLLASREELENMRYLPHDIAARRAIEAKINTLDGRDRTVFLQKLSAVFHKRTGKMFLKDYVESGLLTKDDVRMSKLVANAVADYHYRSAMKGLYDWAKANGYVAPTSADLRQEGWLKASELDVAAPELSKDLIHPVFAGVLDEMRQGGLGRGGLTSELFGAVKQAQFLKPTIVLVYDVVQRYIKGMYLLNPAKEAKHLGQAAAQVWSKGELWQTLNEDGLFQTPHEVSRGSQEEQIDRFVNAHDADLDMAIKAVEAATQAVWTKNDGKQLAKNVLMAATRALAQITWTGDQVLRTQSYLNMIAMGTPHDEAVRYAANSHAAYSALSEGYRRATSKVFFVPSFRILMPAEIAKIVTEPVMETARAFAKGKGVPAHKWQRWAKSFLASAAIPILLDEYMKSRGFEKEGKHLGPLAWKWKKTVSVDGQEHEIIVGVNNILNMPVKYWNRLTHWSPIKEQGAGRQVADKVLKWEAHPLIRITVWDAWRNERSLGGGEVYSPNAEVAKQLAQTMRYVFGESFRFWGGMMEATGVSDSGLTQTQKNEQEKVLGEGLTALDGVLLNVFGYRYYRMPLERRQAIAKHELLSQYTNRMFQITNDYADEPDKREAKVQELDAWRDCCMTWVDEGMK